MWLNRKLLRISWTEHTTNEELLRRMNDLFKLYILSKRENWNIPVMRTNYYNLLLKRRQQGVEDQAEEERHG